MYYKVLPKNIFDVQLISVSLWCEMFNFNIAKY